MTNWRSRIAGHAQVDPRELIGNPKNHRTHPAAQREVVRDSIAEIGFVKSVLVNKTTGYVIDGHERLWQAMSAVERGEEVLLDVEYVELTEDEEAKALAILDASTEMAIVDPVKLDELLRDFNTGSEAIGAMLEELAESSGALDLLATPAEVEEIEPQVDRAGELQKEWGTAEGQLWIIEGKQTHRLLCGDSTRASDVARLMGGETADLIFTSPPYGQQRDYDKDSKVDCTEWDKLMNAVFSNLPSNDQTQVLVNLGLIHRDCEWIPYWENWIEFMRGEDWRRFGWYVWDQMNGLPGDWNGRLAPSFEFVWHFNKENKRPRKWIQTQENSRKNKGKLVPIGFRKEGGSQIASSLDKLGQDTKVPDSVIRVSRSPVDGALSGHSATFPIGLATHILNSWGGNCYEPFTGSGTTMLAAEQLERKCYGMEISPKYCAVILERMKAAGCECTLDSAAN